MIEVKLYQNFSDPFKVHKQLDLIATVSCQLVGEHNVDSLELLLDMRSDIKRFNYCRIEVFGRYYFCTPIVENGNQMRIACTSDPLTSFWDSYKSSECIAERSTSNPNPDLADDLMPFKPNPRYQFSTIGAGFMPSSSGGCYLLTIGGK